MIKPPPGGRLNRRGSWAALDRLAGENAAVARRVSQTADIGEDTPDGRDDDARKLLGGPPEGYS